MCAGCALRCWICTASADVVIGHVYGAVFVGVRGRASCVLHGESSKRLATPRNTKDKKHLQSTQSVQPTNLTDQAPSTTERTARETHNTNNTAAVHASAQQQPTISTNTRQGHHQILRCACYTLWRRYLALSTSQWYDHAYAHDPASASQNQWQPLLFICFKGPGLEPRDCPGRLETFAKATVPKTTDSDSVCYYCSAARSTQVSARA